MLQSCLYGKGNTVISPGSVTDVYGFKSARNQLSVF